MRDIFDSLRDHRDISDVTDLRNRCEQYVSMRREFRLKVIGILSAGVAQVNLLVYMMTHAGNMNPSEATASIICTMMLTVGGAKAAQSANDIRKRLHTVLSKISQFSAEHPTFEADVTLQEYGLPISR